MAPGWYFSVVRICLWRGIKLARMMFTYERVSHMLINYCIFTRQFEVVQLKRKKCIRPVKINLSSAEARRHSELFQCALFYELHYSHVYGFILKLRSPSHWKPLYLFRTFSAWRKKSFIICRITPSTHAHKCKCLAHTYFVCYYPMNDPFIYLNVFSLCHWLWNHLLLWAA